MAVGDERPVLGQHHGLVEIPCGIVQFTAIQTGSESYRRPPLRLVLRYQYPPLSFSVPVRLTACPDGPPNILSARNHHVAMSCNSNVLPRSTRGPPAGTHPAHVGAQKSRGPCSDVFSLSRNPVRVGADPRASPRVGSRPSRSRGRKSDCLSGPCARETCGGARSPAEGRRLTSMGRYR